MTMTNNRKILFRKVLEQSKDKIYRLCLGFTGNSMDADDLFQEILIKVWGNLENFRNESSINTWVYRIATNTAMFFLNSKKRREQNIRTFKTTAVKSQGNEIDKPNKELQINKLYKAISSLKEMDRVIISLLLDNNSYEEISSVTGLKISNVGVRIHRIKKTLNKKLS